MVIKPAYTFLSFHEYLENRKPQRSCESACSTLYMFVRGVVDLFDFLCLVPTELDGEDSLLVEICLSL